MTNEELEAMSANINRIALKVEAALRGEPTRDAVVSLCMILGETIEKEEDIAILTDCIKNRFEEMKQIRAKK